MELGDIGTEFKYETDHMRVWDLVLNPGESSPWHQHDNNYVLLTEYEDGSTSHNTFNLGDVITGHKGAVHRVTNTGDSIYSNAIIEILPQNRISTS